jgi:hypothetical protein
MPVCKKTTRRRLAWEIRAWSHDRAVGTVERHNIVVMATIAKRAALKDPPSPINSSLAGKARRTVDIQSRR